MDIIGYFIVSHCWLLMIILLMTIDGYYIGGYFIISYC